MILVEHGNFMMGATQEQEDPNYDSIGEENFYNLEDFCRIEPKKYL